jgi:peptide/nickel transport system substrate-binding protein
VTPSGFRKARWAEATAAAAAVAAALALAAGILAGCALAVPQMSREQIGFLRQSQVNTLLAKTVNRPGSTARYDRGRAGGTWLADINDDPKSFNPLHAQDAETAAVVGVLSDFLLDYDPYRKAWKPKVASYQVRLGPSGNTMDVVFTLRDDLFWTTLADPSRKVKVTSEDVLFWYNQVVGDPALQQSGYAGQFLQMPDGSKRHIDMERLDERRFVMHYPRVVAMPELSSNMDFGPRYVFEPVKKAKGPEGLLDLWSIDTDPRTIPSMGPYYIESYRPGVSVTLVRNPNYWRKDDYGQPLPYIRRQEIKIVPNQETEKLKFMAGELDSFTLRPEDLEELTGRNPRDYTVYYAGPSLGAAFICWNQNPKNLDPRHVRWFANPDFRRAMSCFFDRQRVVKEVYRGLAEPALYFFARPNPYFDPNIQQQYLYDPQRGRELLAGMGIKPGADGLMRDADGKEVRYELEVPIENNLSIDIANVYADELKKVGVTLVVKPLQFQKIVEGLTQTYGWQAVMISVGANYFPIQGDNVWLSSGNLHLWNPLQRSPATEWENRVDQLYWQGYSTLDPAKAKGVWDRYQRILLDELPVMYLVYADLFAAYRDKWANLRVDTLQSPDMNYLYLRP